MSEKQCQCEAAEHWRKKWQENEAELALIKCADSVGVNADEAMKRWLKTFGFKVFCELKQGPIWYTLLLLQEGDISRGKAAETIAELLVGNDPDLPGVVSKTFDEDEFPSETVAKLRAREEKLRRALDGVMIGGNHLASMLLSWLGASEDKFPPFTTDPKDAQKIIEDPNIYDGWVCWRAIMLARAALAETAEAGRGGGNA